MFRNLQGSPYDYLTNIEEKLLRIKSANWLIVNKSDYRKMTLRKQFVPLKP